MAPDMEQERLTEALVRIFTEEIKSNTVASSEARAPLAVT